MCAFAGGWVMVAMHAADVPQPLTLVLAAAVTTALRGAAMIFDWRLPRWQAGPEP